MRMLVILLLHNAHPLCLPNPFHPGVNYKVLHSQQLTRQSDTEMPRLLLTSQLAANFRHEPCNGMQGALSQWVTSVIIKRSLAALTAAMHACRMFHRATDIPAVLALL